MYKCSFQAGCLILKKQTKTINTIYAICIRIRKDDFFDLLNLSRAFITKMICTIISPVSLRMLKELVFRITSLSARHQQRISSESWNSTVVLTSLSRPWLAENASQSLFEMQQGKTKPVRMSWSDVYWEPHVEGERERRTERERALLSLHDSVPETYFLLLSPQWVTLTSYVLCCSNPPHPCDWWASFCQLMANPLLTIIRLPFISVGVSVMDSF